MTESPDDIEVEVWNFAAQRFIESFRCAGEKRVRVDHHGSLTGLGVFEVIRTPGSREFYAVDGTRPLRDWEISYS